MKCVVFLFRLAIWRKLVAVLIWSWFVNRGNSRSLWKLLLYFKFLGNERSWLFLRNLLVSIREKRWNTWNRRFFWGSFFYLNSWATVRNFGFLVRNMLLVFRVLFGEIFLVLSQNDFNNILILRFDDLVLSLSFDSLDKVFGELWRNCSICFNKGVLGSLLGLFLGVFCKHFAYFFL